MIIPCSNVALPDVVGPMNDLLQKLTAREGSMRLHALKLFLRTDPHRSIARLLGLKHDLWGMFNVGGHDKDGLLRLVETTQHYMHNQPMSIDDSAREIANLSFANLPVCREAHVMFAKGPFSRLFGFREKVTVTEFLDENFLSRHGLMLCGPSDAFYIAHFHSQSYNQFLRFGMAPVTCSGGRPLVFLESHGNALHTHDTRLEALPGEEWVFRHKTKFV